MRWNDELRAMPAPATLTIRRPDDWHVHLRDGAMLEAVAPWTARQFARAIVMPNLVPPILSVASAEAYRTRIMAALPTGTDFTPLMTCYLVDRAEPAELVRGHESGAWVAAKLYPAHATTNSAYGVTDVRTLHPALEAMQRIGMPLLVHGEVTDPEIDIFDREAVFIERVLDGLVRDFPALKIVFEHITTAEAVAFVEGAGPNVAATVTPQHLILNRNAIFAGGIRPHAVPAGGETRAAPAGGAAGGGVGLAEILPRDGQRPARSGEEGGGLRLRRYLQRAVRAGKLCRGVR